MVDTSWMRQMNRRAPALQPANGYDPWAAWKQQGQDPYAPQAPQQTTNWGQVPGRTETAMPDWGPYQRANPATFDYAQAATPQATMGLGQSGQAQMQGTTQTTSVPAGAGVGVGALAPLVAGAQANSAAGGGAAWSGQDYKLPSGEVLPGNASFTLTMNNGAQVRLPGYYDPASASGGQPRAIFMNGTYPETAIQRLQRRLNDAQGRGENINDPNVIYREMARVRDDAAAAIGSSDPNALRAATGFVHLDRFVRGANGETGYTPGPGATAPGAAPGAGGGTVPPAGGGNGQGAAPGGGGGGGIFPSESEIDIARQDPVAALAAYRKASGQEGRNKTAYGGYKDQQMGSAVRALLTMIMPGGGDPVSQANTLMSQLAARSKGGGGIGSLLRDQAASLWGQDVSGFDDKQLLQMMGATQGAAGYGYGPFGQYALENEYDDLEAAAAQHGLGTDTTSYLANPAARQKFIDLFNRYRGR